MTPSDSARQLLDALVAEGVDRGTLERTLHAHPSAAGFAMALLSAGTVTPALLEAAERRWSQRSSVPAPGRLGRYTVERKLGAGACGEVYLVRDPVSGARLAAKRLIELGDVEERQRFQREARTLAQLRHPHLARVHAAELEGPVPFFVLDYYPGGTLQDRLREGPLPADEARALVAKLASALEAAHAEGVLHRDLKPENVLFGDDGEPRLADFGLGVQLTAHASRLTQTGTILGTPSYMAPEQVRDSRAVDARADVYGLGGVLYACLTGRPPVAPRGSLVATLAAVLEGQIARPSELAPVEPWLDAVCLRALAANPARRYPSARALGQALVERAQPPRRTPAALALGLGCLAGGVLLGTLALGGADDAAPAPRVARSTSPSGEQAAPPDPQELRAALDAGDVALAWERAAALPEVGAELGLRLLAGTEGDLPPPVGFGRERERTWAALLRLERARVALHACCQRGLVDQGDDREALVGELLAALRSVAGCSDEARLADRLLLEATDVWLFGYRGQEKLRTLTPPQLPRLDPRLHPAASAAAELLPDLLIGMQLKEERADLVVAARRRLARGLGALGAAWQVWPPLLGAEYLAFAACDRYPLDLLRAWSAANLEPDVELGDVNRVCELLPAFLTASLDSGPLDEAPDLELATRLVDALVRLREQQPYRSNGARYGENESQAAARVALYRGDLVAMQRWLDHYPDGSAVDVLSASLCIERARSGESPNPTADLLAADELLAKDPAGNGAWAALRHLRLLAAEPGRFTPLGPSPPARGLGTGMLPRWYLTYRPRSWRFPCEADDGRRVLWLP